MGKDSSNNSSQSFYERCKLAHLGSQEDQLAKVMSYSNHSSAKLVDSLELIEANVVYYIRKSWRSVI